MQDKRRRKVDRLLDGDSLMLVYQPIVAVGDRRVVTAEALLRVRGRDGEIKRGADVAVEAEERGRASELQERVAWEAFNDASRWRQLGANRLRLNLNLSAVVLEDPDLLPTLEEKLEESGLAPEAVSLELTETSYIEDPESAAKVLDRIRSRGIHLWLDDFGTGHSTLTHLQHFTVDGVKISGDFVRGFPENRRSHALVRGIIQMAHELDLEVVAEGVEDESRFQALEEMGCDYVQGFLISRPLSVDELVGFVSNGAAKG